MSAGAAGTVAPAPVRAADGSRDLIVCLSHLRWDYVFQRPQHLLSRAAHTHDVLFFEEPIFSVRDAPELIRRRAPEGVEVLTPHLPLGRGHDADAVMQRDLLLGTIHAWRAGHEHRPRRMIAWFYTPMALDYAADLTPDVTVYDCMDELSAFRGASPRMLAQEASLLDRADLVFTGGQSLFEAKRDRHPRVSCFPSSIDTAHFAGARQGGTDPADQAGIPHPRVGFFGVIDERLDLALVGELARLRPALQWVMIGPVAKIDPTSLPRLPNLHWRGPKSYAELPAYLAGWDAGFMPFALNESTRFISPTKTPEFLAAGLPVVSTPVTDVVRGWGDAGLVQIAADGPAMAAAIDRALADPRAAWLARVDARLAQESWDATWTGMRAAIGSVFRPTPDTRSPERAPCMTG